MDNEINIFNNYVKEFDLKEEKILMKYSHTFRVIKYSTEIAKSLNLNDEDIKLSRICALFHDIGRFPQYTEFKSYNDYETYDHGDKGEKVLKELNYDNDIVLKAVKYHNKLSIPNTLTSRESMFCNILRDADKIDIMVTQGLENNDEKYDLDEENRKRLLEHKQLQRIDSKNNSLRLYKLLAFIFDVNYKKSFEIIKEKDLINKKMNLILDKFRNEETISMKKLFEDYLEEKLK